MKKPLGTLAGCLVLLLAGCQNPGPRFNPHQSTTLFTPVHDARTNAPQAALLQPSQEPFTLGPGDRLEIELLDDLTTRTLCTVGPDGKIYFHILPGIDVWGMTLERARSSIETELAKYFRDHPQVGITLRGVESKRVWLMGRLQAPGVYALPTPTTLLEALLQAGGTLTAATTRELTAASNTEELADLHHSFIIRQGKRLPVDFHRLLKDGDLSQNVYLQPDDFVYLPSATAREVYVMGAVQQPRAVPYTEGTSLAAVIGQCYGPLKDAHVSHVAIVRGSLSDPRIAIVDYRKISTGRAQDITLEARDIVYVPYAPFRMLTKYADIIASTFVSSVAINEGSRAVLKTPPAPTGILIPLGSRITITPGPATTTR